MKRKILLSTVGVAVLVGLWIALILRARGQLPYFRRPDLEYCWLVFGPEARVRVLAWINGDAVTLEHYDGDTPTARRERFPLLSECKDITLNDPDGKTSYVLNTIRRTKATGGAPPGLIADVCIKGPVEYRQYCDIVRMSNDPQSAAVAHFNGPLTVQVRTINYKVPPIYSLRRGKYPTILHVWVSTMDPDRGCWVVTYSHDPGTGPKTGFPPGVHPFVDVEFPASKPGTPPIKRRYPLEERC